jgi:hypothetical protein
LVRAVQAAARTKTPAQEITSVFIVREGLVLLRFDEGAGKGNVKSTAAVVGAADGLAACVAAPGAFVVAHVVIEAGERVEAPAADGTVQFRLFVVVVAGHVGAGLLFLVPFASNAGDFGVDFPLSQFVQAGLLGAVLDGSQGIKKLMVDGYHAPGGGHGGIDLALAHLVQAFLFGFLP